MSQDWYFKTTTAVWQDQALSTEAKVIWHLLAGFANRKTRIACPSLATLQLAADMGRNRVLESIKRLVDVGAITKQTIPIYEDGHFKGSRCEYTVSPLENWVCRDHYTNKFKRQADSPATGAPENRQLCKRTQTVTHSLNSNPIVDSNPISSPRLATGDVVFSTEDEELSEEKFVALLADRGIASGASETAWDKLSRGGFRNEAGRAFRSATALVNYGAALAAHIEEARVR
jgi:hypothetical protein